MRVVEIIGRENGNMNEIRSVFFEKERGWSGKKKSVVGRRSVMRKRRFLREKKKKWKKRKIYFGIKERRLKV